MKSPADAMQIRPMSVADVARLLEIAANLPDAPHWPQSAYLTALDPTATPRRIALVAVSPASVVCGFVVARLLPPQAELETIAVAPDYQRQGLGHWLFDALVLQLQPAAVVELALEVRAGNRPALGFYRTLGFTKTGLRRGYYTDPVEDAVLMSLRL